MLHKNLRRSNVAHEGKIPSAKTKKVNYNYYRRFFYGLLAGLALSSFYVGKSIPVTKENTNESKVVEYHKQITHYQRNAEQLPNFFNTRLQKHLPQIVENIPKLLDEIKTLTSLRKESGGFLIYEDGKYRLQVERSVNEIASSYIDEFLKGNFSNMHNFFEIYKTFENVYETKTGISHREIEVILRTYAADISKVKTSYLEIELSDGSVFFVNLQNIKELKSQAREVLVMLKEFYMLSYLWVVDVDNSISNEKIVCRFHTHPYNDPHYMPSLGDMKNTEILGNSLLFTQFNDVVRVYVIYPDKYALIFEQKLNK
ncbi:MAG: hypothetical protein N3E37_05120 [Candidatus Micrarchaeota archaeon]|nr:hypothetical protein [Candidatus Micrarchaeota archaeon]